MVIRFNPIWRRAARLLAIGVGAVVFWPSQALAASTYYVAPTGSSGPTCPQAAPCSFSYWHASISPSLVTGDVTIFEGNDGTFGTAASPITTQIAVNASATLEGDPTQPRPVFYTNISSTSAFLLQSTGATLSDIDIEQAGTNFALFGEGTMTRVLVHSISQTACYFDGDATLTDSLCWGGEFGIAAVTTGGGGVTQIMLRNDTIYGPDAAFDVGTGAGANFQYSISDSIVRAGSSGEDIIASQSGGGVLGIALDHSNYATISTTGGATVTAAGSGTNRIAAPLFVNAVSGNFHEAVGSPTIDAGTASALNGPLDLDGYPRQLGAATDVGAYEFLLAPTASTAAATSIAGTAATISGAADPNGIAASYQFQYGTTTGYGSTTSATSAGAATTAASVSAVLGGLAAGTTYHYRIVVTNAAGSTYGADQTFTTLTATISGLQLSSSKFAAAKSGASATIAKAKKPAPRKKRTGTTVSYTLNEAASVAFTLTGSKPGREAHGECAKPTHSNRHGKRCRRTVTIAGTFTEIGAAGTNSFHFTGRFNGHALAKGHYALDATATADGLGGTPEQISFQVS